MMSDQATAARIELLDCTLRDGSYAVDYQFTAEDTAVLCAGLEAAGVKLIEIGHGLGLNASKSGKGEAAATDREYLEAAASVLKKARFGMFFIPGIGREEDLRMAAACGMGFVRIGTNVTEVDQSARYVETAKSLGLFVSANLMKSYALTPDKFVLEARKSERYGADVVVVVDSAGGMLPDDVVAYVSALRQNTEIPVGYHGHSNLGLAMSNSLEAVKAGATFVDSTLLGLGRSAGNAQTEIMVLLLEKLGFRTGIDSFGVMDVAERMLRPLLGAGQRGIDSIGAVSGYAQFHSSFLSLVYRAARRYDLDPRELIVRVSEVERVNISESLVGAVAEQMRNERKETLGTRVVWPAGISLRRADTPGPRALRSTARGLANELHSLAKKSGKFSALTVSGSPNASKKHPSFTFIRENSIAVIGNCEVATANQAAEVCSAVDGLVDVVLADFDGIRSNVRGLVRKVRTAAKRSRVLTYSDSDALVNAADALVAQLLGTVEGQSVAIVGDNGIGLKLGRKLAARGVSLKIWGRDSRCLARRVDSVAALVGNRSAGSLSGTTSIVDACRGANVVVGVLPHLACIGQRALRVVAENALVVDAGVGTVRPDAVEYAIAHGMKVLRLDMRAGLSGEITTVLETSELLKRIVGSEVMGDAVLVAGGVVGRRGDVVVDSITNPTRIIGVANGSGGMLPENEAREFGARMDAVRKSLVVRRLDRADYAWSGSQ